MTVVFGTQPTARNRTRYQGSNQSVALVVNGRKCNLLELHSISKVSDVAVPRQRCVLATTSRLANVDMTGNGKD